MRTIGLIGGLSWQSTLSYYRLLNEAISHQLGGLSSAKICLNSVNFADYQVLVAQNEWDEIANKLSQVAQSLQCAGADFLLIGSNTMHKVAEQVASSIAIPLLHIADVVGEQLVRNNIKIIGLLGTQLTMQQTFYQHRLKERFDIQTLLPEKEEREFIHQVILNELCLGKIKSTSRDRYLTIIKNLHTKGAEGIVLGCTEIALLIEQNHTSIPLYDTTSLHVQKAVDMALSGEYL